MSDRPPPTSYIDEPGTFHPGPGAPGYIEHVGDCRPCYRSLVMARHRGEAWAIAGWSALEGPIARRLSAAPAPTSPLVPAPRSLPARWRRYAAPRPLISLACGAAGALLLPASVGVVLIVVLLGAVAAIRRYAPDVVPAARAIRR